jgi:Dyp-type peroxidase family
MSVASEETAVPAEQELPLRSSTDIQGNILAPFNKPYQRFLFLNFGNSRDNATSWLKALVEAGVVGSTKDLVDHGDDRAQKEARGEVPEARSWVGVSLTSSGFVTLDSDLAPDLVEYDAFWSGPLVDREYRGERRPSAALVGDLQRSEPADWVVGGPGQWPVDALVTVAADDPDGRERAARKVQDLAEAAESRLRLLSWQDCETLGDGVDHFGFKDGISQPGIGGFTAEKLRRASRESAAQAGTPIIAPGEFVLGHDPEPGSYPGTGRPVPPSWMRDGSFQVFLRLRQDVDGWTTQMAELSASSGNKVDVAAKAIGRSKDGSPLAEPKDGELNDFTYDDDPDGFRTPRFAHIRKMNPRDKRFPNRNHRLLRRGISYSAGLHVETPLDENAPHGDEVERGLAFNAFMASIEDQFEFLQRSWASNPESLPPTAADGPDPVAGAPAAPCLLRREDKDPVEINFGRCVWTSGAVYAFAPSIPALRRLAGLDPAG